MHQQGYLAPLFTPKSIAVIGATDKTGKPGNTVLSNLINYGYQGKIFPVNSAIDSDGGTILGLPAFRNLEDIAKSGQTPDLAILAVPAEQTPSVLKSLARIKGKAAIIVSSGFKETGAEGSALENELIEICHESGISLLGPNCLGFINTYARINTTFACGDTTKGSVGFFSQSGALASSFIEWAQSEQIGISSFVSLGNKAVIDESDMLIHFGQDPNTKVIAGYLESVEHGNRFMKQAQLTTRRKPVILLRAGSTAAGSRAASAHTGAPGGLDMAYEAAFKQTGVIRVHNTEELFNLAQGFAKQPLPQGPGLAILTNSGGPGIIAADACEKSGLNLSSLSSQTITTLKEVLPSYATFFNPVDVMSDADADRLAAGCDTVLKDPNVHSLLTLITPPPFGSLECMVEKLVKVYRNYPDKTIFCCLMGGANLAQTEQTLLAAGYPCYRFPEPAVHAIAAMYRYRLWQKTSLPVEVGYRRDLNKAQKIILQAKNEGLLELTESKAQELFQAYEMPMLKTKLARTSDEAAQIAKQFGQPVALKIASPQIPHRTDVNGVALNLEGQAAVRTAFNDITARARRLRPDAYITGCTVQTMAPQNAHEIVVGFKRDQRFGAMIFFGYGGIHLEVFKDLSCRIAPLSLEDVSGMIHEIRAFPVLTGLRGHKSINFLALEDVLLIMSQMAQDFPEIQEASCNPVLVSDKGAVVADMRILLGKA
ncbi:acetate--CoA ligase family protein [Desulfovibrio sp. OttesenSCG-928-C06]|nr:acetate--CoA ligase family protein [Desulfovibrio sp. OttesenSCG-928-C06]